MTNIVMNFLSDFCENLGNSIVVYVERDIESVALSILRARKKYYNNLNTWWSTHTPNYNTIKNLSFNEQVAHQVLTLRKVYENAINSVNGKMIIKVNYEEVCNNPLSLLGKISDRSKELYNKEILFDQNIPNSFDINQNSPLNKDEILLLDTLNKIKKESI